MILNQLLTKIKREKPAGTQQDNRQQSSTIGGWAGSVTKQTIKEKKMRLGSLRVRKIPLLLVILPTMLSADVIYPLGRFPFDLDYQLSYQAMVVSGKVDMLPPLGPFYHSTMKEALGNQALSPTMRLVDNVFDNHIRIFSITTERIQTEHNERTQDLLSLAGGARYQPSQYFGALVLFDLDRAKAIDPDYTGKKWRGLAGDIETAAIYFKKNDLAITLGRQRVFWGPQPINLIISETAEPLDLLSARYRKGRLRFSFFFARLDESRPDSVDFLRLSDRTFHDNRYLVGHRIDITLHRSFRLGLFETSLFGGEGRPPELYYLNPLQFFHTAQLNEDENDNTILGLDFTYLPWQGFGIYGQFIIDDFQIDRQSQGDQEPDEYGLMAGLFKAGRAGSYLPDLKLEYVRITNRTYHQTDPRNRYLFRNKLLGHPLGPDSDSLSLMVRFWPSARQYAALELAYRRHGEGSIYKPWDEPWIELESDYDEPFPTGVVEQSLFVAVRVKGYLPLSRYTSDHLFAAINAGYGSISNHHNVSGQDASTAWLNLSVGWLGFLEVGLGE
jgi:hypothetical protein